MAKTGPQRYPGASTAYWYQSRYPGSAMETNVIVWHSTEGTSLPSYSGGANAPNFTALPDIGAKRLRWYQHFDFDVSSRALRNLSGGVETNTLNVCQVEIVGTCDPAAHKRWTTQHLYMPELPDWAIRDLAAFARWAHEQHGVPLESGLTFKPYPASYGSNGVRMSGSQWRGFRGHCGHQHVPENDHGDPGAFPMAAILARAKGATPTTPEPPEQENDMALTDADIEKIATRVWQKDGVIEVPWGTETNPEWAAGNVITSTGQILREVRGRVKGLEAQTAALQATVRTLAEALAARDEQVDTEALIARIEQRITETVEGLTVRLDVTP